MNRACRICSGLPKDNLAHVIYPVGLKSEDWAHDLPWSSRGVDDALNRSPGMRTADQSFKNSSTSTIPLTIAWLELPLRSTQPETRSCLARRI